MAKAKRNASKSKLIQLKITLADAPVPIWRRLVVHAETPLALVHEVFQIAMGWTDSHLHAFRVNGKTITDSQTANDDQDGLGYEDESEFLLADIVKKHGDCFVYEYDWGDSWHHDVTVERLVETGDNSPIARCLTGKRACPPEDVGGVHGYAQFLNSIEDPEDPTREENLAWIGSEFDPDSFDARLVNFHLMTLEQDLAAFAELLESRETKNTSRTQRKTLQLVDSDN